MAGACASKGRTLRETGAYPAFQALDQMQGEGRPRRSVHFRQDGERADLWVVDAGMLDDEVEAEGWRADDKANRAIGRKNDPFLHRGELIA